MALAGALAMVAIHLTLPGARHIRKSCLSQDLLLVITRNDSDSGSDDDVILIFCLLSRTLMEMTPKTIIHDWFYWALLSAVFAALTAIFAKIGFEGIDFGPRDLDSPLS